MSPAQGVVTDFIHGTEHDALPPEVRHQMRRCLLDLIAVAAAGTRTDLSRIMRDHAHRQAPGGPGAPRLFFDGRRTSAAYAAMANAATIDSMDGHDGHRITKGHAGCAVLPAAMAFLDGHPDASTHDVIASLAVGYEVSLRAGLVLHGTAADYHSSGAWNALGAAAVGARVLGLPSDATSHALGIAEYSAPRAPMMRAIAHPTMVKDSSAWGAQAGVTAALLAADGFTGAPADLVAAGDEWADLGTTWRCLEQYFKPYPVCRWAHPAVRAALELTSRHSLPPEQIEEVHVTTFESATRLSTVDARSTEEAQYSLPFAVAAAMVHGELLPEVVLNAGGDPEVGGLMHRVRLHRSPEMSSEFPAVRRASVRIEVKDGRSFSSGSITAKGDPEDPLSDEDLLTKFRSYTTFLDPESSRSLADLAFDPSAHSLNELTQALVTGPSS